MAGNNWYNAIELSWMILARMLNVWLLLLASFSFCVRWRLRDGSKGDWDGAFGAVFECMKRHAMPLVATYFARGD